MNEPDAEEALDESIQQLLSLYDDNEPTMREGEGYVNFIRQSHELKRWIFENKYLDCCSKEWDTFCLTFSDMILCAFQERFPKSSEN